MLTVKDAHTQSADQLVDSFLWSPRSHHGKGRMKPWPVGEKTCACAHKCVSYRPRSGLFPQEASYSPQANQRTRFETEFNPIGPTLLTFNTRNQSRGRRQSTGR